MIEILIKETSKTFFAKKDEKIFFFPKLFSNVESRRKRRTASTRNEISLQLDRNIEQPHVGGPTAQQALMGKCLNREDGKKQWKAQYWPTPKTG